MKSISLLVRYLREGNLTYEESSTSLTFRNLSKDCLFNAHYINNIKYSKLENSVNSFIGKNPNSREFYGISSLVGMLTFHLILADITKKGKS